MAVIYISEVEAARDLSKIMLRVNAGDEVIIDNGQMAVAVVPTSFPSRRSVSECIALVRKYEDESGESLVMDGSFADDVEEIVRTLR